MTAAGVAVGVVVSAVVLLAITTGVLLTYSWRRQDAAWNRGRHAADGGQWQLFDYDSQGGRGYECTRCGTTLWIDAPGVDGRH